MEGKDSYGTHLAYAGKRKKCHYYYVRQRLSHVVYVLVACASAGSKGKKKVGDVIDLLDEDDSDNGAGDDASQRRHSSPQTASAPRVTLFC